jgi:putative transposase
MVLTKGSIIQWLDIATHFPAITIDEFIIMPNHLHGIIEINVGANNHSPDNNTKQTMNNGTTNTVGSIIRSFKFGVVKWMTKNAGISTVWQRNFHDHIIRKDEDLNRIREYIINNPLNWDKDKYFIVR